MSAPRTFEQKLLLEAELLISRALAETGATAQARLDILEAVASRRGQWLLADYRHQFPEDRILEVELAELWGEKLDDLLSDSPVPASLALAALANPQLEAGQRRKTGTYYTDFRLATHLAALLAPRLDERSRVVDPSTGSGMLLTALALAVGHGSPGRTKEFVRCAIFAADLSPQALRAARASIGSTVTDLDAVIGLNAHMLAGDSLARDQAEWAALAPSGFDAVIGNPPWEKLKTTRHEVLSNMGVVRHYGQGYDKGHEDGYGAERARLSDYRDRLHASTTLQGRGESDLYKLFTELSVRLLREGGELALLVPGGLIRSQGTQDLRQFLVGNAESLSVNVFDNKPRFFAIDTRFKFASVHARISRGNATKEIELSHVGSKGERLHVSPAVVLDRTELREMRHDLTLPEVRSSEEWDIFKRMSASGTTMTQPAWEHSYVREVDMTNDREQFETRPGAGYLPLIEGRAVHQYRRRAKKYVSGTGRAARWLPLHLSDQEQKPQYWFPEVALRDKVRERTRAPRAGFCDITGQTNERTLLAAIIPEGVVCGNKVPTLTFSGSTLGATQTAHLWIALMNSIPVDWLSRRLVTTSVNYFMILSLPLPTIDFSSPSVHRVIQLSTMITDLEGSREVNLREVAMARAEIDAIVTRWYGLTQRDLRTIFEDFPLLDRNQPALPGEDSSTITRDMVLSALQDDEPDDSRYWAQRCEGAIASGAIAYIPADYSPLYHGEH